MDPDQTPPPAARAALESLYYDHATELCDLCPIAEHSADRMEIMHIAIMESLADAHEAGRADALTAGPTIGGPMPEPWPGMGIEWVNARDVRCHDLCSPRVSDDGSWFAWVGENQMVMQHAIAAIYDGRRCIWRRNP